MDNLPACDTNYFIIRCICISRDIYGSNLLQANELASCEITWLGFNRFPRISTSRRYDKSRIRLLVFKPGYLIWNSVFKLILNFITTKMMLKLIFIVILTKIAAADLIGFNRARNTVEKWMFLRNKIDTKSLIDQYRKFYEIQKLKKYRKWLIETEQSRTVQELTLPDVKKTEFSHFSFHLT